MDITTQEHTGLKDQQHSTGEVPEKGACTASHLERVERRTSASDPLASFIRLRVRVWLNDRIDAETPHLAASVDRQQPLQSGPWSRVQHRQREVLPSHLGKVRSGARRRHPGYAPGYQTDSSPVSMGRSAGMLLLTDPPTNNETSKSKSAPRRQLAHSAAGSSAWCTPASVAPTYLALFHRAQRDNAIG
ncbi:hypothetical protein WG922_10685 [Ramlibacter sp. AN1015]|uniref:hypothetical protein n=1 Tax=Ramlibacter sp. AN1015 TaxID=3133428 RepID=UPI0030BA8C99